MSHTVKTSIITDRSGNITGYGLSIEAQTTGDSEEIQAAIAASLELIRQTISSQLAAPDADPPPGHAPAAPLPPPPAAPAGQRPPPQNAAEAEQRFFARYSEQIGGSTWAHVRRYLGSAAARPKTIEGWISAAQAVRDSAQH